MTKFTERLTKVIWANKALHQWPGAQVKQQLKERQWDVLREIDEQRTYVNIWTR